jgi:hypothetical protein
MTWELAGAIMGAIALRRRQVHDDYPARGQVEV